jgi:hypothetical protein
LIAWFLLLTLTGLLLLVPGLTRRALLVSPLSRTILLVPSLSGLTAFFSAPLGRFSLIAATLVPGGTLAAALLGKGLNPYYCVGSTNSQEALFRLLEHLDVHFLTRRDTQFR